MSTLYELVIAAKNIEQRIIESGGEITPELELEMKTVDLSVAEKVEGYLTLMDKLSHEAAYWEDKAASFAKVAKAIHKAVEFRKQALEGAMKQLNLKEVVGVDHRMTIQKSGTPRLIIDDQEKLPSEYKVIVQTTELEKDILKKDLKAGKQIEGAHLEYSESLRVYVNRSKA